MSETRFGETGSQKVAHRFPAHFCLVKTPSIAIWFFCCLRPGPKGFTLNIVIKETVAIKETRQGTCNPKLQCDLARVSSVPKCAKEGIFPYFTYAKNACNLNPFFENGTQIQILISILGTQERSPFTKSSTAPVESNIFRNATAS